MVEISPTEITIEIICFDIIAICWKKIGLKLISQPQVNQVRTNS